MDCPFCTMPDDRIVQQDASVYVVRDLYPASPGHSLIIPRRHMASITEATAAEQDALRDMLASARAALDGELHPDGYNIGINDGEAAGQTVMHLHVHLIPRYRGDAADPRGGVRHAVPGQGYYTPGKP